MQPGEDESITWSSTVMEPLLPRVARQAQEAMAESSQVNIIWVRNGDRMFETKTNFKMESKSKMMK